MSNVVLRPATRDDVKAMIADLPCRIRGYAAELDGELLGLGGLAFFPNGSVGAFLMMNDGAQRYKMSLHKAGLKVIEDARRLGIKRVVALAQPGVEPAVRWLERLGFEEMTIDGETVLAWQG